MSDFKVFAICGALVSAVLVVCATFHGNHRKCAGSVRELRDSFSCDDGASPHLQKLEDGKTYIVCTCKDAK